MPVIQFIPQMYCPTCHLSTRMDVARCLHCHQLLKPVPVKTIKKRTAKTSARSGFRLKVRVQAKGRQSGLATAGKSKSR